LVLLLAPFSVLAYQNPGSLKGAVNDFAGMLSQNDASQLELKLDNFQKTTGNSIVIATVNNLGGDTVENFAVQLFKDWGIGQKDKNNGVLILVSKEDREMRIEVGYGLEGALTDAQSFWIIRDVLTPAFQNNDYASGLNSAVDEIEKAIGGEVIPSADNQDQTQTGGTLGGLIFKYFWFLIFIVIWLGSILGRSKSWWAGGVIGGVAGAIIGFIYGFLYTGIIAIGGLAVLGLIFDYFVSKSYGKYKSGGGVPPWWLGGGGMGGRGGFGGGGGGGFGGFGGGMSGGGGASGKW